MSQFGRVINCECFENYWLHCHLHWWLNINFYQCLHITHIESLLFKMTMDWFEALFLVYFTFLHCYHHYQHIFSFVHRYSCFPLLLWSYFWNCCVRKWWRDRRNNVANNGILTATAMTMMISFYCCWARSPAATYAPRTVCYVMVFLRVPY